MGTKLVSLDDLPEFKGSHDSNIILTDLVRTLKVNPDAYLIPQLMDGSYIENGIYAEAARKAGMDQIVVDLVGQESIYEKEKSPIPIKHVVFFNESVSKSKSKLVDSAVYSLINESNAALESVGGTLGFVKDVHHDLNEDVLLYAMLGDFMSEGKSRLANPISNFYDRLSQDVGLIRSIDGVRYSRNINSD